MTDDIRFLTLGEVVDLHRLAILEHGGRFGLRDQGLLESAVALPRAQFGRKFLHDGVPAMAAAYLFHLCKNQPFVDGNKRVAVFAAEVFLELNQHQMKATDAELGDLTLAVADSSLTKDDVTKFFERRGQHALRGRKASRCRPPK